VCLAQMGRDRRRERASGLQVDAREGVKGVKQEGTVYGLEEPGLLGVSAALASSFGSQSDAMVSAAVNISQS
jgi:hypothetical protein